MIGALHEGEVQELRSIWVTKARSLCLRNLDLVTDDDLGDLVFSVIVDTLLVAERGPFFDAMMAP